MINRMAFQPTPIQFAARRKVTPQPTPVAAPPAQPAEKPVTARPAEAKTPVNAATAFPLYYLIMGGGDGTCTPHFFRNKEDRDKARDWVDKNAYEPLGESDGTLTDAVVYQSIQAFIQDQE